MPYFRTAMAKTSNGPVTSESRLCEPVVRRGQKGWSRGGTMRSRRQFCAATAGAALSMRIANARAANFDLIIKGGRVIDPSLRIDATRDVAIAAGRIAAVEANIAAEAT